MSFLSVHFLLILQPCAFGSILLYITLHYFVGTWLKFFHSALPRFICFNFTFFPLDQFLLLSLNLLEYFLELLELLQLPHSKSPSPHHIIGPPPVYGNRSYTRVKSKKPRTKRTYILSLFWNILKIPVFL